MACKQVGVAAEIAAQRRLGGSCPRNLRPWCVRSALFQRPAGEPL